VLVLDSGAVTALADNPRRAELAAAARGVVVVGI
jgi:hypothetical protein